MNQLMRQNNEFNEIIGYVDVDSDVDIQDLFNDIVEGIKVKN